MDLSYGNVPRGAEGMGIGEEYPVEKYGVPFGESTDTASLDWREMNEAGWDRSDPGDATMIDQDGNTLFLRDMHFICLRVGGEVVATWDEGRWWTPQESAAFQLILGNPLMKMLAEGTAMNRAQRRQRGRGK